MSPKIDQPHTSTPCEPPSPADVSAAARSITPERPAQTDTNRSLRTLRRGDGPLSDADVRDRQRDDSGGRRIRCPRCAWEPSRHDKWVCACLHAWNTFETGGVCPACERQWLDTQCPKCDAWSPHLAWYVDEAGSGH